MFQAHFPSESPHRLDYFAASRARLAEAIANPVAGHEWRWSEGMLKALAGIERDMRERIILENAPDGRLPEVDSTRASLARQADALRHNFDALLAQTVALREAVAEGADPQEVCRDAEDLLATLDATESAETELVLEGVNTDLGAGD
jgi:hypothetical protein